MNKYKTLAQILADPVDLIKLEARIKNLRDKFGNGQLELKDGQLLMEVEDGQRIMVLYDNELYHNAKRIVTDE